MFARARLASGAPLLVLLVALLPPSAPTRPAWLRAHAAGPVRSAVLAAASSDGRVEAWLDAERGLVVLGWPGASGAASQPSSSDPPPRPGAAATPAALQLGSAGWPRLLPDGRLVFERGVDDGHRLLDVQTWVLDPDASAPRAPRPGETLGAWTPPPRGSATRVGEPDDSAGERTRRDDDARRNTDTRRGADTPRDDDAQRDAHTYTGAPIRLCLDPGHGGGDPGAVGNGLQEKDLNLDVALRHAQLLADDSADASVGGSWDVLLTRVDDSPVSLLQRVTMANAFLADSFHSLHANGFGDPQANGTETFAFAEGTAAAALRDAIHARMLEAWGLTDRGTKTAGFYVLVNTAMPAALSEMAFVTNPGDAAVMADPANRQAMAEAHLFALQEHHGFGPGLPGGAADGTLKGILFDASLGVGAPVAGGLVALADGRFTTTNAAGLFAFELPAGTYGFAATAPGFEAASAVETVTSGDVWESLGLPPALNRPEFGAGLLGAQLQLTISGDPGAFAWLAVSLQPAVPPLGVGNKGALWPDPGLLLVLPLTTVPPGGALALALTAPALPDVDLHMQAYVTVGGAPRLSNGAALHLP